MCFFDTQCGVEIFVGGEHIDSNFCSSVYIYDGVSSVGNDTRNWIFLFWQHNYPLYIRSFLLGRANYYVTKIDIAWRFIQVRW